MTTKKCKDRCKSCGVAWNDHLGISGTCAKLEYAITALMIVRTWAAYPITHDAKSELDYILKQCDKTLEAIK